MSQVYKGYFTYWLCSHQHSPPGFWTIPIEVSQAPRDSEPWPIKRKAIEYPSDSEAEDQYSEESDSESDSSLFNFDDSAAVFPSVEAFLAAWNKRNTKSTPKNSPVEDSKSFPPPNKS